MPIGLVVVWLLLAAGFAFGPVVAAGFAKVGAILVAAAVATAAAVVGVSEILLPAGDTPVPTWSNFLLAVLLPEMPVGPVDPAAAATPLDKVFSPALVDVDVDVNVDAVAGFVGKISVDAKVAAPSGRLPIVA